MPIWLPASVSAEPKLTLVKWRVVQIGIVERHFVGVRADTRTARMSSPILALDVATLSGITTTGRAYSLVGPAQWDKDALLAGAR